MGVGIMILVLSLGIDSLLVSTLLGMVQTKGIVKIAVTFSLAEACMPLLGILFGKLTGQFLGAIAPVFGAVILMAFATYLIFFKDSAAENVDSMLQGWQLVLTAMSISLDGLTVGLSLGLLGVPVGLTVSVIGMEVFAFTFFGLKFGRILQPLLGTRSEKMTGVLFMAIGVWMMFGL